MEVDTARLRAAFERLVREGAHNINLVTPTHFLPAILPALEAPLGVAFAKALRDTWSARRPKDGYRIASYEKLASGFRNTILGIDVSGFINRREQESQEEEEF